jgi:methylglutaconyl-CoA hydratase
MGESLLSVDEERGIARITLNRPQKRNALTRELLAELLETLRDISRQGRTRLLVFAAEGTVFCAGMDLAQMQATAASADAAEIWLRDSQLYRDLLWELFSLPLPTLAVVQGPAVAGGLGLVLACDLVLASAAAAFALPEPQRGIIAALVTPLLVYRCGAGRAAYLLLGGQTLAAPAAERFGLIHEVVPHDQLGERERALCDAIRRGSPAALAATKQHLAACAATAVKSQLDLAVAASAAARETGDAEEGRRAFLEHRPPAWQ